jgi:CBS domain-containing protein
MSLQKIARVPPPTVGPGATVMDAVELMAEEGVGAVAVVEKDELRGIFTERDVMLRVVLKNRNPSQTRLSEVMTSPPQTCTDDLPLDEALDFLLEKHIRHLPIVDREGHIHGMLSLRNLLEHMVEYLERELHSLDQYIANDGPGG